MKIFPILLTLTPALLTAGLVFVVHAIPAIRIKANELMQKSPAVDRLREVTHDLSLLGSAAGAYFGYTEQDPQMYAFTVAWFVMFYTLANKFAFRVHELAERDAAKGHRKMAGTVRSIAQQVVRAELDRSIEENPKG